MNNHLSANDYYCENECVLGQWIGRGAANLGFEGQSIHKDDTIFEALRKNRHPLSHSKLTKRQLKNRIAFFDFQCSSPKSVSIMAVTVGDEELKKAHYESVQIAFTELEKLAARQNRHNGIKTDKLTGNVIAAKFDHDASRLLDPQLHTHLVVANATYCKDAQAWFALETEQMCKAIAYAGRVYTNALAQKVMQLGYEIYPKKDKKGRIQSFELTSVTQSELEEFSQRRKAIEEEIKAFESEHGRSPTAEERHQMAKDTRDLKMKEITTPEVRLQQHDRLGTVRFKQLQDIMASKTPLAIEDLTQQASEFAHRHIFERLACVPKHQLYAEALNAHLGHVDLQELKAAFERMEDFTTVQVDEGNDVLSMSTSLTNLAKERDMVRIVNESLQGFEPLKLRVHLKETFTLNLDQRKAFDGALTSHSQVTIIRGAAGTGKSYTLNCLNKAFESAGLKTVYMAPTTTAAADLKEDGLQSTTLADFLVNGIETYGDQLIGAMLVLDEAGLASTHQMHRLLSIAENHGARVLLIGDTRQHAPVEAGDALAIIEKYAQAPRFELKQVERQQHRMYRKASELMGEGHIEEGLKLLDGLGWVYEAGHEYLEAAAQAYVQTRLEGSQALIVAPTWHEIDNLNESIRKQLKARGILGTEEHLRETFISYNWTKAQKHKIESYNSHHYLLCTHSKDSALKAGELYEVVSTSRRYVQLKGPGGETFEVSPTRLGANWEVGEKRPLQVALADSLLVQMNSKELKLKNNDRLRVTGFGDDGTILAEDLQGRKRALPRSFKGFRHGYASTSHKSQGLSADHVIVAAYNLDAFGRYVSLSRGKHKASLFVHNKTSFIGNKKANAAVHRLAAITYSSIHILKKAYDFIQERIQMRKQDAIQIQPVSIKL